MKNKRLLCIISIILIFTSVFSVPASALTTAIVSESNGMNLRSGPGTSYSIIVCVPKNTALILNGKTGSGNSVWYNVTCKVNNVEYTGYMSATGVSNITNDSVADGTYTEGISYAIPDTYLTLVNDLKKLHPNWTFKFLYTGLEWYDVIKNETKSKVNAIENSFPVSYRSTTLYFNSSNYSSTLGENIGIVNGTDGSLNMRSGPGTSHSIVKVLSNGIQVNILDTVPCDDGTTAVNWYKVSVTLDGTEYIGYVTSNRISFSTGSYSYTPIEGSSWYQAHGQVVSYFIDPRNFINENYIFQFEELTYNSNVQNLDGINAILKGSFMYNKKITTDDGRSITYAEAFLEAAKKHNVSPYHLASKVIQEVGRNGSGSTSGTNSSYPGVYNFYNIGANTGYLDGLRYASQSGSYGRPWTTPYKSIIGGAEFISSGYISKGQNTTYLEKFDFISEGGLYQHQYATDVTYAKVQANKTYNSVYKEILSTDFCFIIPVFRNMPVNICSLPASSSQPNLAPDCPLLTDTVDPKPTSSTGEITNPDPPSPPVEIPVVTVPNEGCGDVNEDGKISVSDAKAILKVISGGSGNINEENADLNGDGKITLVDAKWILQVVAGTRDLKVSSESGNAAVEINANDYTFAMPEGWSFSTDDLAFYKNNSNNCCYVKIDNAGVEDETLSFTMENLFNQALGEFSELTDEINADDTAYTAETVSGDFVLENGGNTVKYTHYLSFDENGTVVDSRYFACLLIEDNIYCINYFCVDGIGYDADFDFTEQISKYFKTNK